MENFYEVEKYLRENNSSEKVEDYFDCIKSFCHLDYILLREWDTLKNLDSQSFGEYWMNQKNKEELIYLLACHINTNMFDLRFNEMVRTWAFKHGSQKPFNVPIHGYILNQIISKYFIENNRLY